MALPNKFTATSVYNGQQFHYTRLSATRFKEEFVKITNGDYRTTIHYFTEKQIESAIATGKITITNPAAPGLHYTEKSLPATFYFTNARGQRYTAYVQDDVVTITLGSGVNTTVEMFPLWIVNQFVADGKWTVLPESYRTASSVASEFMQFMENCGALTTEDRVAIAQTTLLLDKVMYSTKEI